MTDALADIRKTEAAIRQTEAEVHQERAELRRKVDTAAADDRRAYAEALAAGGAVPKPTSAKIKDRIRDIEQRILPGCDESLWLLADDVVLEIEPDVDPEVLRKNIRRWQPPDPGHKDRPSLTHHLAYRPVDIVDWVLSRIAAVEGSEAKAREEADIKQRKREAERRVNRAQSEYEREQNIAYEERLATMSVTAQNEERLRRNKPGAPMAWPPFNRYAFLEAEGLLGDYGWVQPGTQAIVKGGSTIPVEQVPAGEINSTQYTEA